MKSGTTTILKTGMRSSSNVSSLDDIASGDGQAKLFQKGMTKDVQRLWRYLQFRCDTALKALADFKGLFDDGGDNPAKTVERNVIDTWSQKIAAFLTRFLNKLIQKAKMTPLDTKEMFLNWINETVIVVRKNRLKVNSIIAILFIMLMSNWSSAWIFIIWGLTSGREVYDVIRRMLFGEIKPDLDPCFKLHPESETMGWQNEIISAFWARLRNFLDGHEFLTIVNNYLKRPRVKWLPLLLRPKLVQFDVGEVPPKFTGIKSYQTETYLHKASDSRIIIECGLQCELMLSIYGYIGPLLNVGMRYLKFNCKCRFNFTPLLRDEKVFGELRVGFQACFFFVWHRKKSKLIFLKICLEIN